MPLTSLGMLIVTGGSYGHYRVSQACTDLGLDFVNPALWNRPTQAIVDGIHRRFGNYSIHFCPICSRLQSFDPTFARSPVCSHCKNQRQRDRTSNFGANNDMDPGEVWLVNYQSLILDLGRAARSDAVGGNVDCSCLPVDDSIYR